MKKITKRLLALTICAVYLVCNSFGAYAMELGTNETEAYDLGTSEEFVDEQILESQEPELQGVENQEFALQEENNVRAISDEDKTTNFQIEYVLVDKDNVEIGETQNVVVGVSGIELASCEWELTCKDINSGEQYMYPVTSRTDEALLFEISDTSGFAREILAYSVTCKVASDESTQILEEVGISASYSVGLKADYQNVDETDSVVVDGNNEESLESIEDAIEHSVDATSYVQPRTRSSNVVIVLDPGHDATHGGAGANGLREADINFKIAQYCKQELEEYSGVTVYLTHDTLSCPYPGTTSSNCNSNRVDYAASVGANLYVALHNNSANSSAAQGCEVYYPNANGNLDAHNVGYGAAQNIQNQLVQLGLYNRGIKTKDSTDGDTYGDGQVSDYYGVIRNAKRRYNMPAIIVEHAFLTNGSDVSNHLSTDAQLRELGVADATGIANYYGLSKSMSIDGICYQYQNNRIDVGAAYTSNGGNTTFKWQAYDIDKQEWSLIADWNGGNWASWQPERGNYWLMVEARNDDGEYATQTICFRADRTYQDDYVDIDGVCWNYQANQIDLGVAYGTSSSIPTFKWQAYDLDRQEWTTISNWSKGNWTSWKPRKGNYWINVQVKTDRGKIEEYTFCFAVDRDYRENYISVEGLCWKYNKNTIDLGVAYDADSNSYECIWMAYNLDKQVWTVISDCNNTNWTTWKPEKGNYWIYVQLKTPSGGYDSRTICFAVDKDYTKHYVETQGICVIDNQYNYNLGVAYESDDSSVAFRWQIYDIDKNQWKLLSDWSGTNWVSWEPENGNYWIYVQGRTSDGVISDYCISYAVTARYAIMGQTNTTIQQMVAYYNANKAYPDYYVSSDAPTIEDFCRIYYEECQAEGVKAEVAFCQAMKETGFLGFGGRVPISAYNFGGLGAIDSDSTAYATFSSVREGIRAQVQHLKAYACSNPLNNPVVDPRFGYVSRGTAPIVEWLGIKENPYGKGWATAEGYGYSIVRDYISMLFTY